MQLLDELSVSRKRSGIWREAWHTRRTGRCGGARRRDEPWLAGRGALALRGGLGGGRTGGFGGGALVAHAEGWGGRMEGKKAKAVARGESGLEGGREPL